MSYTKALRKRVKTMSEADKECLLFALRKQAATEKNLMILSSIKERIEILCAHLPKETVERSAAYA